MTNIENDLIEPLKVHLPPQERDRAKQQLLRSLKVAPHLEAVMRTAEEGDKEVGVNQGQHLCMDPRMMVIIMAGFERVVVKKGAAIGSVREIILEPDTELPIFVSSTTVDGQRIVRVPEAETLNKFLRQSAYSPRDHLQILSPHTGKPDCGHMHGIQQEREDGGEEDPYNGDRLRENIDHVRTYTAGPINTAYQLFRHFAGRDTVREATIILPWETDRAAYILNHDVKDPSKNLTVADLFDRHRALFCEIFGRPGSFTETITDVTQIGSFWRNKLEMRKKIASGRDFKPFQDDLHRWISESSRCERLTDSQLWAVKMFLADNAASIHLLNSAQKRISVLSDFQGLDIFVSPTGVTLNMYDPGTSRLSATPHNPHEGLPQFIKGMYHLSKGKEEMVRNFLNGRAGSKEVVLPRSRIAYISVGVDPNVSASRIAGLKELERSMDSLRKDSEIQQLEDLLFVPILVNSLNGAAVEVPVFLGDINRFSRARREIFTSLTV